MNKKRRNELAKAADVLCDIKTMVDNVMSMVDVCRDEEEECLDNLPDGLRDGEKGDEMQDYIDTMDSVCCELDTVSESISDQIDAIREVVGK